jgi:hypothetical protein
MNECSAVAMYLGIFHANVLISLHNREEVPSINIKTAVKQRRVCFKNSAVQGSTIAPFLMVQQDINFLKPSHRLQFRLQPFIAPQFQVQLYRISSKP